MSDLTDRTPSMTTPEPIPVAPAPVPEVPAYEVAPPNATEPKVMMATGGATGGVIVTTFVLDLVSRIFLHGGPVPESWAMFTGLAITSTATFAAGYIARHVNRPDPSRVAVVDPTL